MEHLGEVAALGTVMSWTATALFFEAAGHRIGSLVVNLVRLVIALAFFVPLSLILHGRPFPFDATPERAFVFEITAWDVNCPQHITPRLTMDEAAPIVAELKAKIEALESQLEQSRPSGH